MMRKNTNLALDIVLEVGTLHGTDYGELDA
jgi:hypothetical protein